jgi:TamB, inner membrane protein subunit of TAM complex
MRWIKPAKLPVLVAWMVIVGLLVWVGFNPQLLAPPLSGLVGKHLLGIDEGNLRVRDYRVRPFEGVDLYGLSLTLPSDSGGMTLVSADTVRVDFQVGEILGVVPRLKRVVVRNPQIFSRAGNDTTAESSSGSFPRIAIEHLVISDAFLEFSQADGQLSERISQLDFSGKVRSDQKIELVLRGCEVNWDTHQSHLDELRGRIVIDRKQIMAESVYGLLNGKRVKVSGSRHWDEDLDLTVEARGVNIAEVEALIDMTIGFAAEGDLDATFRTTGDALIYEGIFQGELEGYQMKDLRGRAAIRETEVVLTEAEGIINGAEFIGSGRFDIANTENVTFILEGDVAKVNLANGLVPQEEDLPVTDGVGRLKIEHSDLPLWTRVSGVLYGGIVEIVPFDSCYVDVEATADSVVFNQIELFYNDLHALLEGRSDEQKLFSGQLSVASEDLSTLPASWEWPDTRGRLYGLGDVNGPLDNLLFDGTLGVFGFELGEVAARYAEVSLLVDDVLGEPLINSGIEGNGLSVGGVPLGDFLLWGSASPKAARIDSFQSVLGDTTVVLVLDSALGDSLQEFSIEQFSIDLEGTHWAIADPVNFTMGEGFFDLPGLEFNSNQGRVVCWGQYDKSGEVKGRLQLEDFDLGLLNPFVQTRAPLVGRTSADLEVSGESGDPTVDLTGRLADADFSLARVDTLELIARFNHGVLDFHDFRLKSEFGKVNLRGTVENQGGRLTDFWRGAELDLDVSIPDGDWLFLEQFEIPALERLSGRFSGEMVIGGSTDDPTIVGNLHSSPFNVHWLHMDKIECQVWADRNELVFADLRGNKGSLSLTGRIEIPMEMDFLSEPQSPLDGPFYMQLEIPPDTDLKLMSEATNGFIQSSGKATASVVVSGPLDHPFYTGRLEIKEAGFVLPQQEEIYSDVSCRGEFRGNELLISDIKGREGLHGRFNGDGKVVFRGLELESFDVLLNLDRFLVASIPDLRAVVSGSNCRLSSVFVGPDSVLVPKFSGVLEIDKARYTGNFKEQPNAADPMQPTVAPDWLGDLKLHAAPRTVRILNREMELYLGGDMDLVRSENGMRLRGTLDVNSGRLVVFNNSFNVKRGRLDFSREVGFDPLVDVDAEIRYRLRSQYSNNSIIEHIGVHVGGTITEPEIVFTSERGYSREAIQRMLMGLEPEATADGDGNSLANTGISAGFNVLERELARELDIFDTIEIEQIQREKAAGESGFEPLVGVGKYIGSDLYLKIAQGIRQDDRDLVVEYQINDHMLLQSEVRSRIDENQGQPTYNLDLKYRFEY